MRTPKTLKTWEFVKDKNVDLRNINSKQYGPPDEYYYQFDGYHYTPACSKMDFDMMPETHNNNR